MTAALHLAESVATRRAGILTRVSGDDSGRERSPEEQERDGRRDCERHGLDVVAVYRDVVPASRYSKRERPDYERAKRDVIAGALDVLWAWSVDRTTRRPPEFEELADICRVADVHLLVNGRMFDTDDGDDLFQLRLASILGAREVDVLRKRVMRAMRANAEAGRPHGRLQWGYARQYDGAGHFVAQVVDPTTAPLVRELFERVADGDSLRSIARDFAARGVPSPSPSGEWHENIVAVLRAMLHRRSYLGERVYRGETVGENCWPALIDAETFERVQTLLADPRRRLSTSNGAKHLLSGLIQCDVCGSAVSRATITGTRGAAYDIYRCKGGSHVGRKVEPLEAAVAQLVIARLSRADALAAFARGSGTQLGDASRELSELRARLDDAEDHLAEGKLSAGAFSRLEAKLSPRIAELERAVASLKLPVPEVVQRLASGDAEKLWGRASIDDKRAVIRALLTMRMVPLGRGQRGKLGVSCTWVNGDESLML